MKVTAFFQTPTTNLENSKSFYSSLGFEHMEIDGHNFCTDGKINIEISDHKYARQGIKIISNDWTATVAKLKKHTKVKDCENGHIVVDPNGVKVYLVSAENLELESNDKAFGKLGNFAGLSIETSDFEESLKFWELLDYSISMGGVDKGWMTLSNGNGVDISLMGLESCPHSFSNPGLTYFNSGKNPEIISEIKKAGILLSEEITCFNEKGLVDNVIIHDPGHTLFFIFND